MAWQRRGERGVALMAVFWVIAILSLMIFTTVVLVRSDVQLATAQKQAFRATQIAEMGLAIAANPTVKKTDRGLLHRVTPEGDGQWDVEITGEGGKFNINQLIQNAKADPGDGRQYLETILCALGIVDNDLRGWMVDNLINWVDEDEVAEGSSGTYEREQYEAEGMLNYPFNRPFYNLDEMLLVKGMNYLPGVAPNWRDFFTIYSSGKIDVNEVKAEVLAVASLAGADEARRYYEQQLEASMDGGRPNKHLTDAQEVVQMRAGKDNIEDTDDDQKLEVATVAASLNFDQDLANARLTNADQTTRIVSTATVGDFRKRIVLVLRQRTAQPQILVREEVPIFEKPPPVTAP